MPEQTQDPYLHIGRATDLSGSDRILFRILEIIPGFLSVGTIVLFIVLSFFAPAVVAYFTIAFAAYWLFKTIFLTLHLRHNFKRLTHNMSLDWSKKLSNIAHDDVIHMVMLPFYKEPYEVLRESVLAIAQSNFPNKQIVIVIAAEEAGGEEARSIGKRIVEEFQSEFFQVLLTVHPQGLPNETPGKGSNIAYAAKEAKEKVIDTHKIPHESVLVSAFDSDTVVYPEYFSCLTWHFRTSDNPMRASFQPVPLYNNNIWESPMLSRVLGYSSTFWQMIQQERPERLSTFSSHAVPLVPLIDANYWQRNMVNEDSRIFFNLFMHYDGNYDVVPISYPVSMDANVAPTFWGTVKNLYKQHLRWSYGSAENIPYLIFHFMKNPRIAFIKKVRLLVVHIEGAWSLAVQPLILFAVGWLPLLIGGATFNTTVLSYNLPIVSSWFLTAAMFGLIFLAVYSVKLVPKNPKAQKLTARIPMVLQWVLVPFTMVIFSSIPGLDAQIRLALGKYLGFWNTPKYRS